jgi:hypothetical protein
MSAMVRIKATSRIAIIEVPRPAIRWDLSLMALVALLGALAHPAPRG